MPELRLPELGENVETVEISAVLVSEGDVITRDQPVIEVETEKASLEVPSIVDGRITQLLVAAGDKVAVGQVILIVENGPAATAAEAESPPPVQALAEAEGGTEEGSPSSASSPASVVDLPRPSRSTPTLGRTVPAAPSVRALSRELGIEIHEVPGSGPGGRITREDVKAHAKRLITGLADATRAVGPVVRSPQLPDFARWGEVQHEPLTNVRRKTAESMANAWVTVPHVTQFDRADITQLESMRKDFNRRGQLHSEVAIGSGEAERPPEAAAGKLTVTALVIKLAAAALRRFPRFNASLDLAADRVVLKRYVHIGVAVETDRGLLVPVIRDVDEKGLLQVAEELNDLASRARSKKLGLDEMQGATFTVSNLGGLGTTYFSPIVNWPEVALLGVGRAEVRAVAEQGRFVPRLILPLSLSYDHRLIDGADAARFLRWIAEALEQPLLLLLEHPNGRGAGR